MAIIIKLPQSGDKVEFYNDGSLVINNGLTILNMDQAAMLGIELLRWSALERKRTIVDGIKNA